MRQAFSNTGGIPQEMSPVPRRRRRIRELDEIRIDQIGRHHAAIEAFALVAPHIAIALLLNTSVTTPMLN